MHVHEYQAKQVISGYGIAVPNGGVARTPEDAEAIARQTGGEQIYIRAQYHAAGRLACHATRIADSAEGARAAAEELLGSTQPTPLGPKKVRLVLVERVPPAAQLLYLAAVMDTLRNAPVIIGVKLDGTDFVTPPPPDPNRAVVIPIDATAGLMPHHARYIAFQLTNDKVMAVRVADVATKLYRALVGRDALNVEINPLIVAVNSRVIAGYAAVEFDDFGLFRHRMVGDMRDEDEAGPGELAAIEAGIHYTRLGGEVACVATGIGLVKTSLHAVSVAGGCPSCYVDLDESPTAEQLDEALRLAATGGTKSILIAGMLDSRGGERFGYRLAETLTDSPTKVPVRVCLDGPAAETARAALEGVPGDVQCVWPLTAAAEASLRAVEGQP